MFRFQELLQHATQLPLDGDVHLLRLVSGNFWVKTQGEEKRNPLCVFSVWLSRFAMLKFFRVNSVLSSAERQLIETQVIRRMALHDLAVPDLVFQGDHYFVTRDQGVPMTDLGLPRTEARLLLRHAFVELARFHQAGFYHGRPALRDIVIDEDDRVTFIDFEESGEDVSSQLMARDVFLLVVDSARLNQLSIDDRELCLRAWASQVSDDVVDALYHIYRFMLRIAFLARWVLKYKDNKTSRFILETLQVLEHFYDNC